MGSAMNKPTDFATDFAEESKKFFEKMFGMSVDKIPSRVHVLHLKDRDIWIDFENVVTLEWNKNDENAIIINGGEPITSIIKEENVREFEKLIAAYERYTAMKTMPWS